MQKLSYIIKNWPNYYFWSNDLIRLWKDSQSALQAQLKRALHKKQLIRLKRGFYLISSKIEKCPPNSFELANLLYGPSYISLDSALSHHGWIPEGVYQITSATSKRSTQFSTYLGDFMYCHIPIEIFAEGTTHSQGESHYLIATPWKAIADLIYVNKISWNNINHMATDLRIDMECIQNSNLEILENLVSSYPSKRVQTILKTLYKNLRI